MTKKHTPTFEETFVAEMEALRRGPSISLELEGHEAFIIMTQLQLALRHPDNTGPSRDVAVAVARALQGVVAVTPTLKMVAESGWVPEKAILLQ